MRYAFIVTISPGYMFALNCNFNANKFYGTNADFVVLHHADMPKEYMDKCSSAFPFKIVWHPLTNHEKEYSCLYHSFFADKYWWADQLKDEYDIVCIIDGDLFICANVFEYFEKAFKEKKLISATHEHSQFPVKSMFNHNVDEIKDRCMCALADFPVFFDPKHFNQFIKDWYSGTFDYSQNDERSHPLSSFNRSVRKNLKVDDVIALDGNQWVCDKNYWEKEYVERDMMMFNPGRVYSIHNRWWRAGRVNNELSPANRAGGSGVAMAIHNFNSIRDFMAKFNNMTPETYWDDYEKGVFK